MRLALYYFNLFKQIRAAYPDAGFPPQSEFFDAYNNLNLPKWP